jgi:hypothetical protein
VNKTAKTLENISFEIPALSEAEITIVGETSFSIEAGELGEGTLFIDLPQTLIESDKTELTIDVLSNGERIERTKTQFLAPKSFY